MRNRLRLVYKSLEIQNLFVAVNVFASIKIPDLYRLIIHSLENQTSLVPLRCFSLLKKELANKTKEFRWVTI